MKKFFKKPLNIASVVLAVLGIIGMIVILCVPHGGTYKTTEELNGKKVTGYYTFKGNDLYVNSKTDGEFMFEKPGQLIAKDVKIEDGAIKILGFDAMKVNAFRIVIGEGEDATKLTCGASVAFFIIAGVMTLVGVAGTAYGALSKKKK